MLRKLTTVTSNGRSVGKLIILGTLLLLIVAYVYHKSGRSSSSSPEKEPKPGPKCFSVLFSQEALERICSKGSNQVLCQVSTISHLDRSEFHTARLQHPTGHMTMMVHPPWDLISKSILTTGAWEEPQTQFIRSSLELLPGAGLLDVGSQLGVYSLHAAQMGRQAVAIDAFYQNSIRLFASVAANGFQDRVRVYWNALALKSNDKMNMFLPSTCNIGGGGPLAKGAAGISDSIDVRTAPLDEIIIGDGCFSGVKELVVKADMEGHEWLVMATGAEVFKRFKVPVIMMEWAGTKVNAPEKAPGIIEFYASHGLLPHTLSGTRLQLLESKDFRAWPWDIFWATKEFAARKI